MNRFYSVQERKTDRTSVRKPFDFSVCRQRNGKVYNLCEKYMGFTIGVREK